MKKAIVSILALIQIASAVEPKVPREVVLEPAAITDVLLNEKVTTMLLFPREVSLVAGAGLTDGTTPGVVQFDHRKGARSVAIRGLGQNGRVLMQVMCGDEIFSFRLGQSDTPDSVVRLRAKRVQLAEQGAAPLRKVALSDARMAELLSMGKAAWLRGAQPAGGDYHIVASKWEDASKETVVERLIRFEGEDVIVIAGKIRNHAGSAFTPEPKAVRIRVGGSRILPPSKLLLLRDSVSVASETGFVALLIGDGNQNPAHFSAANKFELIFVDLLEGN